MISRETYAARRKAFMGKIQGGVAILRSAPMFMRGRGEGVEFSYRQDSDFYYLTGFDEPESVCILAPDHPEHKFILFVPPRNQQEEIWTGKRAGTDGALANYGADVAYTIDQLDEMLGKYLENVKTLYYSNGQADAFDEGLIQLLRTYRTKHHRRGPDQVINPGSIFDELRLIKDEEELQLLRQAAAITAEAHSEAMKAARPGQYEYEVQAVVEYVFRKNGSLRPGYASIVGSGPNACTLHYEANTRKMEDNELLLIDAGAEYIYYSADITRTFPVSGRFTPGQRAIYDLVLKAEIAAIEAVKPGLTLTDIHNVTVQVITSGLVELGILKGDVQKLIEDTTYKNFYMHGACHWLGLDVHDRGIYKRKGDVEDAILQPGMVFTIEPGIYISDNVEGVDHKYWNIGVRIEDNVIVTADGCEVITAGAPKLADEIEALMAR